MCVMIASSISSPPTRRLCETTMPPRLITATSVVPPPMSTIMFPVGSPTGSPRATRARGGAAADVDDLFPRRLADGKPRADRGRHRLLDQVRLAGAGGERRLL